MFIRQKNTISFVTGWIGRIGFLLTLILDVYWMIHIFQAIDPHPNTLRKILVLSMLGLCSTSLVISGPLILSLFFLKMFPSILLSPDGVEYQDAIGLSKGIIKWREIKKIVQYSEKIILLVVEKEKRALFFDGLYFNRLYALILGRKDVVFLLSSGLEDFSQILQVIIKNSDVKTISKKAGL